MRQLSQRASLFIVNACNLSLSLRERWLPQADGEGFPKEIGGLRVATGGLLVL